MNATAPSRTRIVAAFAAIYLVWGSTYLGIRFAIETIPPFLMGGARFILAGAVLYAFVRPREGEKPTLIQWRSAAVIGAFLIVGGNGAVVWAEQFVPSGMAALLVAILPFWIVLIEWLKPGGRRPTLSVSAGLLLGIIGIVVLVGPSSLLPGASHDAAVGGGRSLILGTTVLMAGSLSWALGSLYSRHAPLPRSAMLSTAMEMFCGGVLLFALGIATREPAQFDLANVSAKSFAGFIYLTSVGSLVGFTAYIWLLKVQPASRVATYAYVNPIVAVFLGWALAGEPLTLRTAVASAIIIGAVALITSAQSSLPLPESG